MQTALLRYLYKRSPEHVLRGNEFSIADAVKSPAGYETWVVLDGARLLRPTDSDSATSKVGGKMSRHSAAAANLASILTGGAGLVFGTIALCLTGTDSLLFVAGIALIALSGILQWEKRARL